MGPLISVAELRDSYEDHRIIDVQFTLGGPPSREEYLARHLPTATHLPVEGALSGHAGSEGRHPLPVLESVKTALELCGVHDGDSVVVYDGRSSLSAARAWWVLRYFGFTSVRVLNGGMAAWIDAGEETTTEIPEVVRGTVTLSPGHESLVELAVIADIARRGELWDVRAAERYRGEVEPIDAAAGHVPGAHNAPATQFFDESGCYLPVPALRDHAQSLGIKAGDTLMCGSGITAAQVALGLAAADVPVGVYVGSWSEWSFDPTRPIAST